MMPTIKWETGKRAHQALSDAAAPIYDQLYAKSNEATRAYMDKEEEIIKEIAAKSADLSVALDLGSGTGRDAVVLSKRFEQVFGYDFSKGMVNVADARRLRDRHGNVAYKLLDLEVESLPHGAGTVGLVNTGFGMASFLQAPSDLFKEIRRVLVPQGHAIFSFYNKDSYARQLSLPWRPSLAAISDPDDECLHVTLPDQQIFKPSAKMYTVREVENLLSQYFNIVKIETYPSLSALMPQELFSNPLAVKLCREVDNVLAGNLEIAAGHYIIAVCQKPGKLRRRETASGFTRALELINREGLAGEIKRHAPIKTMRDAERIVADLNVTPDQMLKSVLIAKKVDGERTAYRFTQPEIWLVVTQANRSVDFSKLSKLIETPRNQLELAKLSVLEDFTGFTVGAIPPFAMPKNVPVILDERIAKLSYAWCGTGDPTQSIKIPIGTLEKMATSSYQDISKEQRAKS